MTAGDIMASSAALLNDTNRNIFTNAVQLPYLRIAFEELQEMLELNNIGQVNKTDTSIVIPAGVTSVNFEGADPKLPADLIEIQALRERINGTDSDFLLMTRKEFLPSYVVQTTYLLYWAWQEQSLKFIGATSDINLRIDYIASTLPAVLTEDTIIRYINAKPFLEFRTAALCAQFIGENPERSNDLNIMAQLSIDRNLSINVKGRQSVGVRRRPFRAGYKSYSVY